MRIRIYYWKDIKWIHYGIFANAAPAKEEFEKDYIKVLDKEINPDHKDNRWSNFGEFQIMDFFFEKLNLEPENYILPLPEGATHTSMSIGDIIVIDNDAFICCPIGWEQIKTLEEITKC